MARLVQIDPAVTARQRRALRAIVANASPMEVMALHGIVRANEVRPWVLRRQRRALERLLAGEGRSAARELREDVTEGGGIN